MTSTFHESKSIPSKIEELDSMRTFVRTCCERSPLPATDRNKVVLAVDEAVTNIIEHGYGADARGSIDVTVESDPERLVITIRDSGRSFDPGGVVDPDVREHVRQGRRKGLGIFLMRRIMDEVHYRFKEGVHNELVLIKRIEGGKS